MKFNIVFLLILILIPLFSFACFADNITLYGSIDDSSSMANLLTDCMRNDENFDPFNAYAIVRAGDRDYRIYFGKDLDSNDLTMIRFIPAYGQIGASLDRFENRSLNINENGFYYCSSEQGKPASKLVQDYKLSSVLIVIAIIILILILFKHFKRSEKINAKFYRVK